MSKDTLCVLSKVISRIDIEIKRKSTTCDGILGKYTEGEIHGLNIAVQIILDNVGEVHKADVAKKEELKATLEELKRNIAKLSGDE